MSFYIGERSDNSEPLLHLASGTQQDASQLQADPIGETLFHSGFPYIGIVDNFQVTTSRFLKYNQRSPNIRWSTVDYVFDIPEDIIQKVEQYTSKGYFISINGILPGNGAIHPSYPSQDVQRHFYKYGDLAGRDDVVVTQTQNILGPRVGIQNITGTPRYLAANRYTAEPKTSVTGNQVWGGPECTRWGTTVNRFRQEGDVTVSIEGAIPQGKNFQMYGNGVNTQSAWGAGASPAIGLRSGGFTNSGSKYTSANLLDINSFRSYVQGANKGTGYRIGQYTINGYWAYANAGWRPSTIQWNPDRIASINPTLPSNHPAKCGAILNITVLNIRYDEATNKLTHIRPTKATEKIHISKEDLEIGDLQMKSTGVLTIFKDTPLKSTGRSGLQNSGHYSGGQEERKYYESIMSRSLRELGQIPLIGSTLMFPQNTSVVKQLPYQAILGQEYVSFYTWAFQRTINMYDPRHILGTDIEIEFNDNEIAFKNPQGQKSYLASRNTNFGILRLGDKEATNVTFPAVSYTYEQLYNLPGTRTTQYEHLRTWDPNRGGQLISADPNPPRFTKIRQVIDRVPLPPGTTTGNYFLSYILPPRLINARAAVNMKGKVLSCDVSTRPVYQVNRLSLTRFDRSDFVNPTAALFTVAAFSLTAAENVALSTDRASLQCAIDSTAHNRWQGVKVTYGIQPNFNTNQMELFAEYWVQNQSGYFNIRRGIQNGRINKLGVRDVVYTFPEISLGLYTLGAI